mmetsp:Transcript_37473/g.75626  ORF Transcript_37473/g.75626 Transcript_37473/m.75626 type:complete len:238 (-) Transcript_37473:44-757(-)
MLGVLPGRHALRPAPQLLAHTAALVAAPQDPAGHLLGCGAHAHARGAHHAPRPEEPQCVPAFAGDRREHGATGEARGFRLRPRAQDPAPRRVHGVGPHAGCWDSPLDGAGGGERDAVPREGGRVLLLHHHLRGGVPAYGLRGVGPGECDARDRLGRPSEARSRHRAAGRAARPPGLDDAVLGPGAVQAPVHKPGPRRASADPVARQLMGSSGPLRTRSARIRDGREALDSGLAASSP